MSFCDFGGKFWFDITNVTSSQHCEELFVRPNTFLRLLAWKRVQKIIVKIACK